MSTLHNHNGPLRDATGVAKYRHEAIAVVLRSTPRDGAEVLVIQREREPFAGKWALSSGPLETDETLPESIRRHLNDKAGLADFSYIEQLVTSSAPGRDPFDRTVATSYMVLVPWDVEWELPTAAKWVSVSDVDAESMAFDHEGLIGLAIERLKAKLSYSNIGFAVAPAEFRISDLAAAYAGILDHDVDATNLQRILCRRGQLDPTAKKSAPGSEGGRPAQLFRFAQRELVITDQFATLRPK